MEVVILKNYFPQVHVSYLYKIKHLNVCYKVLFHVSSIESD